MSTVAEIRAIQDEAWTKFAAAALQALVATTLRHKEDGIKELAVRHAAEYADAMLKEWEKR